MFFPQKCVFPVVAKEYFTRNKLEETVGRSHSQQGSVWSQRLTVKWRWLRWNNLCFEKTDSCDWDCCPCCYISAHTRSPEFQTTHARPDVFSTVKGTRFISYTKNLFQIHLLTFSSIHCNNFHSCLNLENQEFCKSSQKTWSLHWFSSK